MMLRSFVSWLDDYLTLEEPAAVVKAAIGLMSFAVLLGAILGRAAVRLGALVTVLFAVLCIVLILLRDRSRLRGQLVEHEQLISRYGDVITDIRKPAIRILRLEHVATIERNGDVRESIRMRVVALKKRLYFIPHRCGPAWNQPWSQLRKVKVEVRGLSVDGERGTRWLVTKSWQDGKLHLLANLHSPVPMGSDVFLEITRDWPGKCIPLMRRGQPEPFTYSFTRPIDYLSYVIVLPPGIGAICEPIGFQRNEPGFSLGQTRNREGRVELTLVATDVPVDQRIGLRLETTR